MNIKFIGTGNMGSLAKNNTSILLNNILLDCGMGTIKALEKTNNDISNIKYVVISHYHADHFFDLLNLLVARRIRKVTTNLYIIGPVGICDKVSEMMKFSFDKEVDFYEYSKTYFVELEKDELYENEEFSIKAVLVKHDKNLTCYGYLLNINSYSISYSGDCTLCKGLDFLCENSDYIFIDTTFETESNDSHLGYEDLLKLAQKYDKCVFYPVHRNNYSVSSNKQVNIIFKNDGDTVKL